ncbi:MAG TPA: hypothetical protein VFI73_12295 [Candidatus Nitrosopolaris sp.]|nr:hypothetical protein [Candidatus Nitrosopolaris sp.]
MSLPFLASFLVHQFSVLLFCLLALFSRIILVSPDEREIGTGKEVLLPRINSDPSWVLIAWMNEEEHPVVREVRERKAKQA